MAGMHSKVSVAYCFVLFLMGQVFIMSIHKHPLLK